MAFSAIEIFALILSFIVLLKLILLVTIPDFLFKLSRKWFKNVKLFQGIILILGAVVLYYLLQTLSIVQIFAVTLFVGALYALILVPYAQKLMKLFKQYIDEDCDIKVSIPFPEINRTIKGKLATNVKEEVTVALINEKY